MKVKDKNLSKKSRKSSISIVLYVAASIVALTGIALLVNNIFLFRQTVNQYVAQGYPATTVVSQLIPSQLLPGIFEPIALYGGTAFVLLGVGIVNKKVSKCLTLVAKDEIYADIDINDDTNNDIEENIFEQNVAEIENTGVTEQVEAMGDIDKAKKNTNDD